MPSFLLALLRNYQTDQRGVMTSFLLALLWTMELVVLLLELAKRGVSHRHRHRHLLHHAVLFVA